MEKVELLDPSELYRPEKVHMEKQALRNYNHESTPQRVKNTYYTMHTNQCVDFVKAKVAEYSRFDKGEMSVMEALDKLNSVIDESDPDVEFPNIYHAYQTAERVREKHPDKDWFQLTGLIHDLGKLLAVYGEPQWSVVGDTFPVGCAIVPSIVFGADSFKENPDTKNPKYNTRLGIYKENCGLERVQMSWGHDEYLYQVLKENKCALPEEALYAVRYHSFYPWHSGGDYKYLCSNHDAEMLEWIVEFNQFDLYSKTDDIPDIEKLRPYYQTLVDTYCPGKLRW
ncbi:PREDICTED: inositol oxygenase-like [Priapulus caudatus]|uniref:Inositol oxygenase n=1 Tax=Priapulus caudatus TaxID=37621 RepID=A0ABM1EAP7_PRICU|nr:PREDICTED: inositol oxygenase-like [Priapulus caudatus]